MVYLYNYLLSFFRFVNSTNQKFIFMKHSYACAAFIVLMQLAISSCSKCYDCSYVTEIENNGVIVKDTVTDEFCTASSEEIDQKEKEGQTCVSK